MEFVKPGININFVGKRRYAYAVSLLLILATVISLIIHGGPNYGVDFAGGTLVQVQFQEPTTAQDIRQGLSGTALAGATIQRFGDKDANEFLIRVQGTEQELEGISEEVQSGLESQYGQGKVEIRRVEMVGAKVGQDLRQKALFAIFYAILFIVIYISGRFEMKWLMSIVVAAVLMGAVYVASIIGAGVTGLIVLALLVTLGVCFFFKLKFALGAIIALIHDVIITLGVFSLFNIEVTLTIVAALLTIVGYSLNDTIIVFDRIRENSRRARRQDLTLTINESINQTLSRTVLTSGTTILVVLCLLFLGGPVISDFALAMTVGIIVGTYSSIYVASPILLLWPPETTAPKRHKAVPKAQPAGGRARK